MHAAYLRLAPRALRNDVVGSPARGEASIAPVAKDFGVSESCLQRWLELDDIEAGKRPAPSKDESAEFRELKKRDRLLEQEAEVMRRAVAYLSRDINPRWCTRWSSDLPRPTPSSGCRSR